MKYLNRSYCRKWLQVSKSYRSCTSSFRRKNSSPYLALKVPYKTVHYVFKKCLMEISYHFMYICQFFCWYTVALQLLVGLQIGMPIAINIKVRSHDAIFHPIFPCDSLSIKIVPCDHLS